MIEITLKTLIESYANLKKVSEFNYLVETRFKMAKALMYVEREKALYDKQYKDLLKKHGEQIDLNRFSVKKENVEAYNEDLEQLQSILVKIPVVRLLHTNVQEQIEAPADIVALSWLIHFPEFDDVKAVEEKAPAEVEQSQEATA